MTHLGINKINADLKVVDSQFFYEDFDSKTGVPTTYLSPKQKPYNPFAVVGRELNVENQLDYFLALEQIPQEIKDRFSLYWFYMYSSEIFFNFHESFAPIEMNILIPFFIQSAKSDDEHASYMSFKNLCMFNDKQIIEFLLEHEKTKHSDKVRAIYIKDCFNYYIKKRVITR